MEISPIYFDKFDKFPPITITCDFNETLRADCDALYKKLEEAGVEAHLVIYKNTFHAFAPIGTSSPETMRLMIENISFMKKCWGEEWRATVRRGHIMFDIMIKATKGILSPMIHGFLRASHSRNPKTPQIRSFFCEKWLLFGVLRDPKPCFFMQA